MITPRRAADRFRSSVDDQYSLALVPGTGAGSLCTLAVGNLAAGIVRIAERLFWESYIRHRLAGGFEKTDVAITNGALVVLYHTDLEALKAEILRADGKISKDIFDFPGGRRFHFKDPSGNELAVWSDK